MPAPGWSALTPARFRRLACRPPGLSAFALLLLAGCATPGPNHVYTAAIRPDVVRDLGPEAAADIPSFLAPGEELTGLAYDPFTDHLFLRLAPGNRIRVVDRPARSIKREFRVAEPAANGDGGDLAIRPRDGHIFAAHSREPALVEFTRFGKYVGTITLTGWPAPPLAVAYDRQKNRWLVLRVQNQRTWLGLFESDGRPVSAVELAATTTSNSAGFDAEKRELYVPLADGLAVGVFDESGRLLRTVAEPAAFVDAGPRSFVRVF